MKLLVYALFLCFVNFIHCYEPKVTLKLGTVTGLSENVNGKNVNVFLGIPYAKPPIEELRFRKPQPITEKWNSVIEAKKWPNVCIQNDVIPHLSPQNEDCLYLNIWTATNLESDFTNNLKPVMVWIHGGGFTIGSSSFEAYNASVLSTFGDVVVVSMNYRVGILGFLYGGSDEMPGNMGLYDQALALEWVQENIAYFGGNKDLVTIFGESAGSMSTVYHLLSPDSHSLFKHVISMSGVGNEYIVSTSIDEASKRRNLLARALNCQTSSDEIVSESTLKCLRQIKADKFRSDEITSIDQKIWFADAFVPVFGEKFIPKIPKYMWKEKLFKRGSSLLIGSVPNEGSVLHLFNYSMFETGKNGKQLFREHLQYSAPFNVDIEEAVKFYFSGLKESEEIETYLMAISDIYFHCPINEFAAHFSKENEVYKYLLDYKLHFKFTSEFLSPNCKKCQFDGTFAHTDELPLTFGTTPNEHDKELSLQWMKIITDFAKTGKAQWPAYYTTKNGEVVPKYYRIKNIESESKVKIGYRAQQCQFWSPFLFS